MVIVRLKGGLGNQMFQYAAGRMLALSHGAPLKLDISAFTVAAPGSTIRHYALDVFEFSAGLADPEEIAQLRGHERSLAGRVWLWRLLLPPRKQSCFRERCSQFDPAFLQLGGNVYLDGYWQSERYFHGVRKELLSDFTVRFPLEAKNRELAERIATTESVSFHVRRGDYVDNQKANELHGICSLDYYRKAFEYVAAAVDDPHLFVFSDDPSWAREHLRFPCPVEVIDHNGPRAYEDLRLMSLCRHNVIANSSFSWWGAWLNRHPGKIVVAPLHWFRKRNINTGDLIPAGWIRM